MKQHSLYQYEGEFDYNELYKFLENNKDTTELCVSGGGDPLNNFDIHRSFYYDFLFPAVDKINMTKMDGIDIHTRIPLKDANFWKHINRCVFSINFVNGKILNEGFLRWIKNII